MYLQTAKLFRVIVKELGITGYEPSRIRLLGLWQVGILVASSKSRLSAHDQLPGGDRTLLYYIILRAVTITVILSSCRTSYDLSQEEFLAHVYL